MLRSDPVLLEPVGTLARRRIGDEEPSSRRRQKDNQAIVGFDNLTDNAERDGNLLIRPDLDCPDCSMIMAWRSAHPEIFITDGTAIKLSEALSGGRHLHTKRRRKRRETKERWRPVA